MDVGREPKRALKHWRVLLDKLCTLLAFSHLQQVVGDWFPHLQPSHVLLQEQKPEDLQDIYAILIQDAKPLSPLKGKSPLP